MQKKKKKKVEGVKEKKVDGEVKERAGGEVQEEGKGMQEEEKRQSGREGDGEEKERSIPVIFNVVVSFSFSSLW